MIRRFKQSKSYFDAPCRWGAILVLFSMPLLGVATGCARFDANGDPSFAETSSMSSGLDDSTGILTGDGESSVDDESGDVEPDEDLTNDESETTPTKDDTTTGTEDNSLSDDSSTSTFDTDSEDGSSSSSATEDDSSSSESTEDSSESTDDSESSEDDGDSSETDDSENSDEDESEDILKCAELPLISPEKWCSEEGEEIRVKITNACSDIEIVVARMRPNCRPGERNQLAPGESLEIATHVGDWFVIVSPDQMGVLGAYQMQAEDADKNLMWPPVE